LPVGELFRLTETIEGKIVPVDVGFDRYHDYAIVEPEDVRLIFRASNKTPIHKFRPLSKADIIRPIHPSEHALLAANDLVVSGAERDRFEQTHNIGFTTDHCANGPNLDGFCGAMPPTSFAGRPSIMRKITDHFVERCKANVLEPSLQKEGDYLFSWAQLHIKSSQIPTTQTIRTAIRVRYREHASKA
jgi:hypothetical protein